MEHPFVMGTPNAIALPRKKALLGRMVVNNPKITPDVLSRWHFAGSLKFPSF